MDNWGGRRKILPLAIASILGAVPAVAPRADLLFLSFDGWFTMIAPAGESAVSNLDAIQAPMYGNRTPIDGTLTFDTFTGAGTGSIAPFSFLGNGDMSFVGINLQAVGDGSGGPGTLMLGNMDMDWNASSTVPVSLVMDASGFFGAAGSGLTTGHVITGGVAAATEDFVFGDAATKLGTYLLPMGASPMVTTTFDTTNIGTPDFGANPSGTLPFTDDGIGGSPMPTAPFAGFNVNIDITSMTVNSSVPPPVPVPAAVWLFASGLARLTLCARRRRRSG